MNTIEKNGKLYFVLKANKNGKVQCPFCEKPHKHGTPDGHRLAHCGNNNHNYNSFIINGHWLKKEDGYFIEY